MFNLRQRQIMVFNHKILKTLETFYKVVRGSKRNLIKLSSSKKVHDVFGDGNSHLKSISSKKLLTLRIQFKNVVITYVR